MSEPATSPRARSDVEASSGEACLFNLTWKSLEDELTNTWQHYDMSAQGVISALEDQDLPKPVIRYLTRAETRPAARVLSGGVALVLRGINFNESQDPVDMVSLRCFLEPNRLVTVRSRWLASVQETRKQIEEGESLGRPTDVLLAIVEKLTAKISRHIETLDSALGAFEVRAEGATRELAKVDFSGLRRQIASVYRFIAPQRSALTTLVQIGEGRFSEDQLERIIELEDLTQRYAEDLELHRERASSLLEAQLNTLQAEQNRRSYALSLVAGLFLPATFVTGLFGMNVAGLPGTENPSSFLIVAGAMVVISGAVYAALKLNKWL
ncbi:MAG: CorA family divalent cation transporter [Pseudomonadales bacterium]